MPHQLVAAGLLVEATVVGCKLYSVTSDPMTQREGLEEEKWRKRERKIIKETLYKDRDKVK